MDELDLNRHSAFYATSLVLSLGIFIVPITLAASVYLVGPPLGLGLVMQPEGMRLPF